MEEPKVKDCEEPEIEKLERKRRELLRVASAMLRNMRKAKIVDKHGAAEIMATITVAAMIMIAVARAKTLERAIARKMTASTATRSAIWRTDWAIDEDPGAHRMPLPA